MIVRLLFFIISILIFSNSSAPANLNYNHYLVFTLYIFFFFEVFYMAYTISMIYIFIIDHILPISFLYIPLCYSIYNPFSLSTITLLCTTLLILIILVIPLIFLLSYCRSWNMNSSPTLSILSWSNPLIYLYGAIALFYPLFWGIYGSLTRYLRLGTTLHINILLDYIGADVLGYAIASLPLLWWPISSSKI